MNELATLVQLSHTFGTDLYILGGGGNTSYKDADTLWVKPSGTTLKDIAKDDFVRLNRSLITPLYESTPPDDAHEREAWVKARMTEAVLPDSTGRPSVEAPLHDSFAARFVVHTHPPLVNGLTCAKDGAKKCAELFPDALWIEYVDPGYVLSIHVREEMQAYAKSRGQEPQIVMLKNHGIFIAGDDAASIETAYAAVLTRLRSAYAEANIATNLPPLPSAVGLAERETELRAVLTGDEVQVCSCPLFAAAEGPLSPDHIVHHKAFAYNGMPTANGLTDFREQHGYSPRLFITETGIFGVGATPESAALAIAFAKDGALICQLAACFGGVNFMTARDIDFIENWEVEAYRRKIASV